MSYNYKVKMVKKTKTSTMKMSHIKCSHATHCPDNQNNILESPLKLYILFKQHYAM